MHYMDTTYEGANFDIDAEQSRIEAFVDEVANDVLLTDILDTLDEDVFTPEVATLHEVQAFLSLDDELFAVAA